jgi:Icc protein
MKDIVMTPNAAEQANFTFVHFTDTHVMAGGTYVPREGDWQCDTHASLQRVVGVIKTLDPQPAFAVIGGDLASPDLIDPHRTLGSDDYDASYRLFQELIAPLPCPAYLLLGNHDNRPAFHRVMHTGAATPHTTQHYSFDYQGYHFVALDSHVPGEHGGVLNAAQLAWLRDDLAAHRQQPTMVFVHHHPWPVGVRWVDDAPLHNGTDLVEILDAYDNVLWLVCGHVHLDSTLQRNGLTLFTTPSTCFQLSRFSQTPKTLPGPPGFRLVRVNGLHLSTQVVHLHGDEL